MFLKEFLNKSVLLPINLLVRIYELLVLVKNALEDHLANSGKRLVIIILTNSEVNVVSLDEFLEHFHEHLKEPKHLFVLVRLSQGFAR